jgi:plastocyanin
MTRRPALIAALATIAAVLPAATATAADQTVLAVDGTAYTWSPNAVTVKAGETVTWTFPDSDVFHNVASDSANWSLTSPVARRHPPVAHVFPTPGTYAFVCVVHRDTMTGTVTVTDANGNPPPPPPPPPLSEQPFVNDQPAPTVLEIADESRPALTRVRVARLRAGARVRFRLSEPASVTVRVKRGRRTVRSRRVSARKGTHAITVGGLRSGTYRVEVLARDPAGNRSRLRRARLTVR